MALMGVREYGRHRNVSHVAVLKALRTGRIRQSPAGLIDSDQADRDWARNTHPAPRAPRLVPGATTDTGGFSAARTVREHYNALLLKFEYERRLARLVNADEVKVAALQVEAALKECVHRIPDRVAVRVAGTSDVARVHEVLVAEIRRVLEEFANRQARATE